MRYYWGADDICLLSITLIAAGMDLAAGRISNRLILVGIGTGLLFQVSSNHREGVLDALMGMSIPVITLYLLFLMHVLGAGDIKLFSVAGVFLGIRGAWYCIIFSFILGAAYAGARLLYTGTWYARLRYLISYISLCLSTHTISNYDRDGQNQEDRLHFAVFIFLGVLCYLEVNQ